MNPPNDGWIGNPYVASFAGALLGLKAIPGTTLLERVANLLLGFLLAIFAGPALVDYLHVDSVRIASAIVFACGAGGLVAFAAVMDGVRQVQFGAILTGWLRKKDSP
jgi:hypothetical protein